MNDCGKCLFIFNGPDNQLLIAVMLLFSMYGSSGHIV
jgi:hypothetical protein